MKRLIPFFLTLALCAVPVASRAQGGALGKSNFALKLDYIRFHEEFLSDNGIDSGLYVGVSGYSEFAPKLYVGGEVGLATPSGKAGSVETELIYIPMELNVKYADEAAPDITIGFGGGISYNYIKETRAAGTGSTTDDDLVLGGQLFFELLYTSGGFFAGFDWKYQITDEFKVSGTNGATYDYSNWRFGGQAGVMF